MAENKYEKDESPLEILKENYEELQKKYCLPDFNEMNKEFQIEKVADCETDFLIREIRKFVAEKFSNYLRFIETILHPVNAPMFIFSIIKSIGADEKKELKKKKKKLAKYEVKIIKLDMEFDEKKEAKFINDSYKTWQKIKEDFLKVINVIEKNWDNKLEVNGQGYFG